MAMKIKVRGGTPNSSAKSLCLSCSSASIVRGDSESEQFIGCRAISFGTDEKADQVPFGLVTECSSYTNKAETSLRRMEEQAWVLVTDRARTKIGFQPAKVWHKENEKEELIPDHIRWNY